MSNDTTLNLEFRHKKKSYLEDVQKYLEEKKKRWSKLENSGKEMSVLMKKVGVQSPNQLVTWGFNFENITKSEGEYVLSADTWANQNSFNTHVTGSEGELADLLVNFPELIIKGTYEDEYGRGSINQSEQEEEEIKEENDEDDGDDEDSASNDDENGDDESEEEEEEEQNDMPLSSRQNSKKQIKGYRFTKDFNVNAIDYEKELNLEMVLIPAGTFMMGSPESEDRPWDNETQHKVTLTKPFYLGKFTITQEQWKLVVGNNPSQTKGAKLPVTGVSWDDCQDFIKKLNANSSGGYRLPTESEWEYACRAGTTTAYSFGDNITPKDANYFDSTIGKTLAVGSYKPNAFGLYDMHGNVHEWCEGWYEKYPVEPATDPKGPATGEKKVLRGGSFGTLDAKVRSSFRFIFSPSGQFFDFGFRLARTI